MSDGHDVFHVLPPEVLLLIKEAIYPQDLENFVVTCKTIFTLASRYLRVHQPLKGFRKIWLVGSRYWSNDEFTLITIAESAVCQHPLLLLQLLQQTSVAGQHITELQVYHYRPCHTQLPPLLQSNRTNGINATYCEAISVEEYVAPVPEQEKLVLEYREATITQDCSPALALLLPMLTNLRRLSLHHVGSTRMLHILRRKNPELLPLTQQPCLQQLHSLEITYSGYENLPSIEDIAPFFALPSLKKSGLHITVQGLQPLQSCGWISPVEDFSISCWSYARSSPGCTECHDVHDLGILLKTLSNLHYF